MPFVSKFSRGKIKPEELNRIVSDLRGIQNGMQEIRVKSAAVLEDIKVHGAADIAGAITNNGVEVDNRTVADARYAMKNGDSTQDFSANTLTVNAGILAAIDKLVASSTSIVDVFLYDTTKDSDGGAWRKRCQHLSWYNEQLNTATRGKTREFPALALILATTTAVTIYDATDPTLPMWKSVTFASSCVFALNGSLFFGTGGNGFFVYNFPGDFSHRYANTGNARLSGIFVSIPSSAITGGAAIVNNTVNDVAATVLSAAPTDPATGLPVPTVAVATAGGVSVINNTGTICNSSRTASTSRVAFLQDGALVYGHFSGVAYGGEITRNYTSAGFAGTNYRNDTIPSVGVSGSLGAAGRRAVFFGGTMLGLSILDENPTEPTKGMVAYIRNDFTSGILPGDIRRAWLASAEEEAINASPNLVTNGDFSQGTDGWTGTGSTLSIVDGHLRAKSEYDGPFWNSVEHVIAGLTPGKAYGVSGRTRNFGTNTTVEIWQEGGMTAFASSRPNDTGNFIPFYFKFVAPSESVSIRLSYSGDSIDHYGDFDDISVHELTEEDRSVKAAPLAVKGTLTKAPVATGAEVMGYSGFSASNYLEEPYSADLDFATGDFAIFGWIKENPNSVDECIMLRGYHNGTGWVGSQIQVFVSAAGKLKGTITDDGYASIDTISSNQAIDDSAWHFCFITRRGSNLELYVDGVKSASDVSIVNAAASLSNANATLSVGRYQSGGGPLTNGSLALWRATAYAPSADQIRAIYEAERHLFQENAKCLLGGTSNAVQALAHDPDTDQLYVGTADGVSVFQGARRVDYIQGSPMTSANIKAIGAARGAVLIGTGAEAYYSEPERNLREMFYQLM